MHFLALGVHWKFSFLLLYARSGQTGLSRQFPELLTDTFLVRHRINHNLRIL
jgi:hypothetical protein